MRLHNHFENAKDYISLGSVLEYDANVLNSGRFLFTKIETNCFAVQNVEWGDSLTYANDVLKFLYYIKYLQGKQTNVEVENLSPTIFYVIDPTVIFCEVKHA